MHTTESQPTTRRYSERPLISAYFTLKVFGQTQLQIQQLLLAPIRLLRKIFGHTSLVISGPTPDCGPLETRGLPAVSCVHSPPSSRPSLFPGKNELPDAAWRQQAIASLVAEIRTILDGAMRMENDNGLLLNYLDDPTWFGEVSGSSLLASVAYRLATLSKSYGSAALSNTVATRYIECAEGIRVTLASNGHIASAGIATPAVNPLDWNDRNHFTALSPEGNNFVILLYTAWRDCVKAGIKGCKA